MKTIYLWVPDDQETWGPPRAIQKGKTPPKPGDVYVVKAANIQEGLLKWNLCLQPEPDRVTDKAAWLAWETARDSISPYKGEE